MFHFGLYKEGLKKSTFVSALFIALMMLGAIAVPIAQITGQMNAVRHGWATGRLLVEGLGLNVFLVLALIAFAPILTLYLFSFLNRRNSSDFYHSIPHRRETLYISYLAAVLTWVLGGIWLCAGVSLLIYAFASTYIILNLTSILLVTLGLSVGSILVIGATLIAMSLTGSSFSNIVTALLIIFLPRTIIYTFIELVVSTARVVSAESFGFIGNWAYNIPFGFVFSSLTGLYSFDDILIQGILYTAVLGLIYLGLGLWLFRIRKSETAQSPATNKIAQTAIRVALAFVVCIPAVAIITEGSHGHLDLLPILILYAIAVLVYFAYELITTKKLSHVTRALPGLGILLLVNILFITGVNVTQNAILGRQFQVDQIASVRIQNLSGMRSGDLSYEDHRARLVSIEDSKLTEILLEALARDVDALRGRDHNFWNEVRLTSTFLFETRSGGNVQRTIRLTEAHFAAIMQRLNEHEAYRTAQLTLPERPVDISIETALSQEALWDIYDTLRAEVLELDCFSWNMAGGIMFTTPASPWTVSVGESAPAFAADDTITHFGTLRVWGFIGHESYANTYSITSLTPRTADRFVYHINAASFADVEQALEGALAMDDTIWIHVQGLNTPYAVSHHLLDSPHDPELIEALLEAVRAQRNTAIDKNALLYSVRISGHFADRDGGWVEALFFFNAEDEALLEQLVHLTSVRHGHGWHDW